MSLKRFLHLLLIICLLLIPGKAFLIQPLPFFKDVTPNTYYYEPVKTALENNIISSETYFYPERPLTRAEFIVWTVNTLKLEKITPETPSFSDVPKTHWVYPFAETAKKYGLIAGTYTADGKPTGKFEPAAFLNRAQAAVIITKAFVQAPTSSSLSFPDLSEVPWAKIAIQKAVSLGFFAGYQDKTFGPGNSILRADGVTVLARVEEKLKTGALTLSFKPYNNACDAVANAQFQSLEAFEFGLGPAGTKVKWFLSFGDKTFEWLAMADVPETGTYTCSDFKITGEVSTNLYHARYSGEYDQSKDILTWQGVAYERIIASPWVLRADDTGATPEGIQNLVNANNQFALKLYPSLTKNAQGVDEGKNIFFLPIAFPRHSECSMKAQKKKQQKKFNRYLDFL